MLYLYHKRGQNISPLALNRRYEVIDSRLQNVSKYTCGHNVQLKQFFPRSKPPDPRVGGDGNRLCPPLEKFLRAPIHRKITLEENTQHFELLDAGDGRIETRRGRDRVGAFFL